MPFLKIYEYLFIWVAELNELLRITEGVLEGDCTWERLIILERISLCPPITGRAMRRTAGVGLIRMLELYSEKQRATNGVTTSQIITHVLCGQSRSRPLLGFW